jgi:hypothetical protein
MGVVPPPLGDHAHRIRTTVPCPPGTVNLVGIRVVLDRIDPPRGRIQALAEKAPLAMMVYL